MKKLLLLLIAIIFVSCSNTTEPDSIDMQYLENPWRWEQLTESKCILFDKGTNNLSFVEKDTLRCKWSVLFYTIDEHIVLTCRTEFGVYTELFEVRSLTSESLKAFFYKDKRAFIFDIYYY